MLLPRLNCFNVLYSTEMYRNMTFHEVVTAYLVLTLSQSLHPWRHCSHVCKGDQEVITTNPEQCKTRLALRRWIMKPQRRMLNLRGETWTTLVMRWRPRKCNWKRQRRYWQWWCWCVVPCSCLTKAEESPSVVHRGHPYRCPANHCCTRCCNCHPIEPWYWRHQGGSHCIQWCCSHPCIQW